jgi:hypothetical protein
MLQTFKGELKRKELWSQQVLITQRCGHPSIYSLPPWVLTFSLPFPLSLPPSPGCEGELNCGVRGEDQAVIRVASGAADEPTEADPGEILTSAECDPCTQLNSMSWVNILLSQHNNLLPVLMSL